MPATLSNTEPTWTALHWTQASVVRIRILSWHGPQYLVDLFQPIHLYIKIWNYSTICIVFWYTNSFVYTLRTSLWVLGTWTWNWRSRACDSNLIIFGGFSPSLHRPLSHNGTMTPATNSLPKLHVTTYHSKSRNFRNCCSSPRHIAVGDIQLRLCMFK